MKNLTFQFRWLLTAGAIAAFISLRATDANAQEPQQAAAGADVRVTTTPKLPYGVEDVLKLSQAKISDDVIVNYIHNSGTVYNLQPQDIVYLRNQGVSDQVLNTMVSQRTQVAVDAQAAVAAAQNQAQSAPAPAYAPGPDYNQSPAVEAPAAPPQSTVYVIPNSAAYSGYAPSYSYPYAYYYGGYYAPVVSFGFGCGPTYYHGGWHGYYHGGGGWHGGSHTWHGGGIHVASTGFHGSGGIHASSGGFHGGGGSHGSMHR
jgi:hypothetical protein